MGTPSAGEPSIEIEGEFRPQGKGPHDDVEVRVAYSLVHAATLTWFMEQVELLELRVSVLEDGYRVMLKGTRKGKHLVAFFRAASWREAITLAATSVDCGYVTWWPDQYPPKT